MSEKWARAEVEGDSPKVKPPFDFEIDGVKWEYGILESTGPKLPERHEGETDEEYRARIGRRLDELVGGADA